MDTDQIILSPAKRARRCVLTLFVLSIIVAGVYVGLHSDRSPFRGNGIVVSSSDAALAQKPSSAPTQQAVGTKDAPVQVSTKDSIASAYLVAPSGR